MRDGGVASMSEHLASRHLTNIGWGIKRGLILAATYALIALAISALNPEAFIANDTTLAEVFVIYFAAGITGGAVIGIGRPLLYRKKTAYVPAVIAMTIAVFGTAVILDGHPRGWTDAEWFAVIVGGPLFGVLGVHSFWRETALPE